MKAVEQHDDAVVANLEQSIGEVAFGVRVASWIVDHVRRYGASNVMVDRTESTQVNDGELRVLVVLESGRTALKYQWVLPPNMCQCDRVSQCGVAATQCGSSGWIIHELCDLANLLPIGNFGCRQFGETGVPSWIRFLDA